MRVEHGDCLEVMARLADEGVQVDAVVTDPPYHLTSNFKRYSSPTAKPIQSNGATGVYGRAATGFMGKQWDGGDIAIDPETWARVFALLKPGGHLLAFGGSRTYHRMACAIEDAGFEIRDQIMWLYGSGFPKSHDVSKTIDRAAGAEREVVSEGKAVRRMIPGADQNATGSWIKDNGRVFVPTETAPATDAAREWEGWGTALKPAHEPICMARKPLVGTVAANVLEHGTGAINVDGCRVGTGDTIEQSGEVEDLPRAAIHVGYDRPNKTMFRTGKPVERGGPANPTGRWPANVCHDGSDEVEAAFAQFGDAKGQAGAVTGDEPSAKTNNVYGQFDGRPATQPRGDTGSASRFFYCSKTPGKWRTGSKHPTVKPVELMRWLVRMVTPKGGVVLDPFAGTGTTGEAARMEGMDAILIEREAEYVADIHKRMGRASGADAPLFEGSKPHD